MDLGLKNLNVLVTGASTGLGYATARIFAEEGARVVINSRDAEKLGKAAARIKNETRQPVQAVAGDIGKPEEPARIVAEAIRLLGGLDILVTSGGGPRTGSFASLDDSAWAEAIDLTLMSYVRLIRSALPALQASKHASVLTVTSISAKQPIQNLLLSNTLRAGVLGLIKSLSLELADQQIRFNSILPGWTSTDRAVALVSSRAQANHTTPEEEMKKQNASAPLGRMATPEEFGRVAVFLSSPAASYMTGAMISVDGGQYKALL
jgi:3-oxoacyl-[acyl-carrier protein] reductase